MNRPHPRASLGLGTVQFGMQYGVANAEIVAEKIDVASILEAAKNEGVSYIDTAMLYGNSEAILGQYDLSAFKIITKTPQFTQKIIDEKSGIEIVDEFEKSLEKLQLEAVYGLLLHAGSNLLDANGSMLWSALEQIKARHLVKKIGVSVYDPETLDAIIRQYPVDIVQLPLNVLDQRMLRSGLLKKLKQQGIEVHVRSVFLQGLLLMEQPPEYFSSINQLLSEWHQQVQERGLTTLEAAVLFVRDLPEVDALITGVTSVAQLNEIVSAMNKDAEFHPLNLACNDTRFTDPSRWRLG